VRDRHPKFHEDRDNLEPAEDYLARKREGASAREARRAHKTHLGRRVIRRMWADQRKSTPAARTPGDAALVAA
jgi:hypothetical protein